MKTIEAIIDHLQSRGVCATWEHPGYLDVGVPGGHWAFGTETGMWGGALTIAGRVVRAEQSTLDPWAAPVSVARWIAQAIRS